MKVVQQEIDICTKDIHQHAEKVDLNSKRTRFEVKMQHGKAIVRRAILYGGPEWNRTKPSVKG